MLKSDHEKPSLWRLLASPLAMSWDFSKAPGVDNWFVNFTSAGKWPGGRQALKL